MQRLKHIALGDAAASPDLPPAQEDVRADDLGALRIPCVPEDFALTQPGAGIPEVGDDEEGDEAAEESPEEHVPELPAPVGNPALPEPEPCAAVKPLTLQDRMFEPVILCLETMVSLSSLTACIAGI